MFRFGDSFGHLDITAILTKYTSTLNWNLSAMVAGVGTFGRTALRLGAPGNNNSCTLSLTLDSQPTWIVMWYRNPGQINASEVIWSANDGATLQVDLRTDGAGTGLIFTRNGTQLGSTIPSIFTVGVPTHICVKTTIHPSAGTVDVWINGVNRITLTGQNTRTSANSTADTIWLKSFASGAYINDFVILDGTGSENNDWPGDEIRGDAQFANSDSTPSQFTPSTGSAHYALVDEATPNGDTDYLSDGTSGHEDMKGYQNSAAGADIIAVQHCVTARKDDAGLLQFASQCTSSATTTVGATKTLAGAYQLFLQAYEHDPDTSAPWTLSGRNAAKFGEVMI